MPYNDVLVHTAQATSWPPADTVRVEGDYDAAETFGAPFPCCLFLPLPGEENRRGRSVVEPTCLLPGTSTVNHKQRLRIVAPEVTGEAPVDWQVLGVQPFGRPGSALVGKQATLRRVLD